MRVLVLLVCAVIGRAAWGGSTYSLPIPKPDTRPISLANSTPIDVVNQPVTVVGEYGGHVYHPSTVPLLKRNQRGRFDELDQTVSVGSTVKILAFVIFRGNYYYRLESQGNSAEAAFIDGRFLVVPSQVPSPRKP